jgi:hypothetical protein
MLQTKLVYQIKNHLCSVNVVSSIVAYMKRCGKIWYSQIGYKWHYNKTHNLWMRNSYGYRRTLRMCNHYCFSMAKMVKWRRIIGTLYSSNLNLHKHSWLTSTPRWCNLRLFLYTYIACLVCLLHFCNLHGSDTPAYHYLRCAVCLNL